MKESNTNSVFLQWLVFLFSVMWLTACTSIPNSADEHTTANLPDIESTPIVEPILPEVNVPTVKPVDKKNSSLPVLEFTDRDGLWDRLEDGFNFPEIPSSSYQPYLNRLLSRPHLLATQIESALPYLDYVLEQVEERGLPTELALLPYIESGYQLDAKARSGAAGAWQIMPSTARALEIEVNWWNDERLNLYHSTQAALDYLQHLYEKYNDWNLVLIAYNAGPGRLNRALQSNGSATGSDFTQLGLPRETLQYVPKLHAYRDAVVYFNQTDSPIKFPNDYVQLDSVVIDRQIDLKVLASLTDLTVDEILDFNPGYRRWATSPNGDHEFLLPVESAQLLESNIAELDADQFMPWTYYTIRPGDTLGELARTFGIPVNDLKRLNNMKKSRIIAGQTLKIPSQKNYEADNTIPNDKIHIVSPGDSLWKIARRYGLTVQILTMLNNRSTTQPLFPGEQLRVAQ